MVKDNVRILVTGEYWHEDFRGLISSQKMTITLCPLDRVNTILGDAQFDLVVIAQSRRGMVETETIESLQSLFATTPKIALLGSWCEGEVRSGEPWPGITRVYWHQWQGRSDQFIKCLENELTHEWQLPATATDADRVAISSPNFGDEKFSGIIGVSAWTKTQYSMLEDALHAFGAQCSWIERSTWDGEAKNLVKAVVLDDESLTGNLENRIRWVFSMFGQVPLVLTLGFPRKDEVEALKKLGVGAIVSKPFKLADLKNAVLQATEAASPMKV